MDSQTPAYEATLFGRDDPAPVETFNAAGSGHAVLVCDHASNRVPERLGTLGLEPDLLTDHIGWDPGAADVAHRLAEHLDSPLVLSGYSRLVIDCNRPLGNAESIAERSAGVFIPGNRGLSPLERSIRIDALFRPYHGAIVELLDGRSHRPTVLISIHSFTPVLNGRLRPWHIGISHWCDQRLAALLIGALRRTGDFTIGDNEPYPIENNIDYTIPFHGEGRGLPSVMIEIRQDEILTSAGAAAWAARLAAAYCLIEVEIPRLFGFSFQA
ncbi:MAG: N-formylglutamate amidohydrolase [Gammaproteobacteria bacterium]|nr:N-formylglutamate amidohydrolase [Gammaproteobacteria bacterium]